MTHELIKKDGKSYDVISHVLDFGSTASNELVYYLPEDDIYVIWINSRTCATQAKIMEEYRHAVKHILEDDLSEEKDVQEVEAKAHGLTKPKKDLEAELKRVRRNKRRRERYWEKKFEYLFYRSNSDLIDDLRDKWLDPDYDWYGGGRRRGKRN